MSEKISAESFYDNFANTYDDIITGADCDAQHLNEVKKIFEKYYIKEGTVLDIGCGTGLISNLLQGDFEYTGIDISNNMLQIAAQRGYKTIQAPVENALSTIEDKSYDFVIALGSLLLVEDIQSAIKDMKRIARKAILLTLDNTSEDYIKNFTVQVYNHSFIEIPSSQEDYQFLGWISPTTGIPIETRIVYAELT